MSMVNNPIKLRCEYLGIGCLSGNYTHGCLKCADNNGKLTHFVNILIVARLSNIIDASSLPFQELLQSVSTPDQYNVAVL